MIEKFLVNKFKKQLGSQYEVYGNDFFEDNFTKPILTQIGQYQQLIQYDTFERYKDKVIAVVQIQPAQYASTSSTALNTTYTLTLWVPINFKAVNSKGEYLTDPKFNVDKDLKDLREALNNKTLNLGNGLRGELTFSEPVPVGNGYDNTGSYKRKLITVSGKINITSTGYLGRDYKIEIGKLSQDSGNIEYMQINDIISFAFAPQITPVENHMQGNIIPQEEVEAVKQVFAFKVNDISDNEELNDLFTQLSLSGERSQEIFLLKVSKLKNEQYKQYVEYPVYISASLTYEFGNSDVGVFSVNCSRCEL